MSRISPLQNAHKKGLFGDCQEKNGSNLLKIREITDVKIYQVVQYKKSSVSANNIQLGSVNLPTQAAEVSIDEQTRIQWFAPRSWIIFSNDNNISSVIENTFNNDDFANFNEKIFDNYLSTTNIPDPELMIRTSGEQRISNFYLWQLAYTELFFTDILWPDFNKKELNNAIFEFKKRDRRFGSI